MTDDEKTLFEQKVWDKLVAEVDASFKRVEAAWRPPEKRTSDPSLNGSRKGQPWVDFEKLFGGDD